MTYLGRILYSAASSGEWGEHELDYILFLKMKEGEGLDLGVNENEVKATRFISREELSDFVQCQKVTPWFALAAKELLPAWWDSLDNLEAVAKKDEIVDFTKGAL